MNKHFLKSERASRQNKDMRIYLRRFSALDQIRCRNYNNQHLFFQARSSGVEYLLDMQGVGGSKPPVPIDLGFFYKYRLYSG